eukprot:scaffold541_cov23-Cyclotella_meneghiniana.AAC.3
MHLHVLRVLLPLLLVTLLHSTNAMISPESSSNSNNDSDRNRNANIINSSSDTNDMTSSIITSPNDAIILTHLSKNYNASSATLERVTKKWEEEMKSRRIKLRNDWKKTFDEIREGSIGSSTSTVRSTSINAGGDAGGDASEGNNVNDSASSTAGNSENRKSASSRSITNKKQSSSPLLLNKWKERHLRSNNSILVSWEKQLQQWSRD